MPLLPYRQWARRGVVLQQATRHLSSASTATPAVYVAATRQHTGKTSVSLALLSGLQKRFDRVGVIKPVGQVHLEVETEDDRTVIVDKDAALFKRHFQLDHVSWDSISPVLIPAGYTRDYLNGKISYESQVSKLQSAYADVADQSDIVLAEGTGHVGVGSIVDANNAQVASWIRPPSEGPIPMILVVNGGLGSSIDEFSLNHNLCQTSNVPVAGVIVNRVLPNKYEQTLEYIQKALDHRGCSDIPILGCIPDRPFLGCPSLTDLEKLLQGTLISGRSDHAQRHYRVSRDVHLVACSLEVFLQRLRHQRTVPPDHQRTLFVCHASRQDILLGFLMEAVQHQDLPQNDQSWQSSMVITGCSQHPLPAHVLEIASALPAAPPILMTPHNTDQAVELLFGHTAKLNIQDTSRVETAVAHYEPYIDFDRLLERVDELSLLGGGTRKRSSSIRRNHHHSTGGTRSSTAAVATPTTATAQAVSL